MGTVRPSKTLGWPVSPFVERSPMLLTTNCDEHTQATEITLSTVKNLSSCRSQKEESEGERETIMVGRK